MSRWIGTISGTRFDAWNIKPDDIKLIDIATGISNVCRFSGQVPWHYSVAQHSLLISRIVPEKYALEGLMHDAAEAYLGDVPKPIRTGLADYNALMKLVETAIASKFELVYPWPQEVEIADTRMFMTECVAFKRNTAGYGVDASPYANVVIAPSTQDEIKGAFIKRFVHLSGLRPNVNRDVEAVLESSDD